MNSIVKKFPEHTFLSLAVIIMVITLCSRLINLSYNSAFNDEAIYVIVGLMGIFEKDWWTYNASAWIPGVEFFYPSITAIAYQFGGIVGSRLLNVLLGVLMVETIFILTTLLMYQMDEKVNSSKAILAGAVAAALVGGSEISHYVSRLATYDMPSFAFFFLGLLLLVHSKPVTSGKRYFSSAIFLSISYLTKIITGIYLPFTIVYFYFFAKRLGQRNLIFWKKYFLIPTLIILFIFLSLGYSSLYLYYSSQADLVKAQLPNISEMVWENSDLVLLFWLVGSFGMFIKKQFHAWTVLTFAAFWVIAFHIFTSRTLSMDKHILLMISFLSIVAGIGISNLLSSFKNKRLMALEILLVTLTLGFYWFLSYQKLEKFNHQWQDLSQTERKMSEIITPGDKVLTESGAAIILATYDKNYPPNTTTFDWLEYRGITGEKAFEKAVRDGYFEIIQLEGDSKPKSSINKKINKIVKENLKTNYKLVFSQNDFYIYQRAY